MRKSFILLILLGLTLVHCGYSSIYSNNQSVNFKIISIDINGDAEINNLIKANLTKYTYTDSRPKIELHIKLNTKYEKKILTKDLTGTPTDFKLSIETTMDADILDLNGNIKKQSFKFSESINIKNDEDNFEQKKYERTVKRNMTTTILGQITFNLTNIK